MIFLVVPHPKYCEENEAYLILLRIFSASYHIAPIPIAA